MSRIVVTEFVSLDGVMEDPGGAEGTKNGGWTFKFERGPRGGEFKVDELMAADALLLGRVTYQTFAAAWPAMGGDEFGDRMNSVPKYVVSSTLADTEAIWGDTTVLRGDVVAEITKLRSGPGGDLLVEGSCQLVHTLAEHGLVDEYRLMVFPIILGSGKRLFPDADAVSELTLTSEVAEAGTLLLTYQPV
ncbi:MAG TPA: dihydrofolate reductase family protein [Acidimicrobiales bacterium]|nr:dihydrofolate reductase family protein [Acidimicrobiales bacterium]